MDTTRWKTSLVWLSLCASTVSSSLHHGWFHSCWICIMAADQRAKVSFCCPQRNAPVGGTTTKKRPAATKCTWGMRTTGRPWILVRKSTAPWLLLSPTKSCSSYWRSRWILTRKSASAETSASEFLHQTEPLRLWTFEKNFVCCYKDAFQLSSPPPLNSLSLLFYSAFIHTGSSW